MRKQLMKGNEAIVKSAILAGCRAFYGYPITPASEIAEAAAAICRWPAACFCRRRARSPSINMIYGAASAGRARHDRVERPWNQPDAGRHQLHGRRRAALRDRRHRTRGGPGLGNIGAEQGDYHQAVKGGGHGNYRTIVLAPTPCRRWRI
jgi:2-oxoisovalerate ferredoxin oxidoreductase alpha subunit